MAILTRPRTTLGVVTLASLALLATAPVQAAKIPEREYVPAGVASVINVRIDSGCDGAPTDGVQVSIPEAVSQVVPMAIPGWTTVTTTEAVETADGPAERVATIDWSGGTLPDGQFMDFGFRGVFPDEPGTELTFPVTQRCGSVEMVEPASDGAPSGLTVRLGLAFSGEDVAAAIASVDDLLAQVEALEAQTGEVQVRGLRDRVEELEAAREELAQRLINLRDRIRVIEDASTVPSAAPTE